MSDPELIGISETTHEAKNNPGPIRRKKTEEVQNLSSASEEIASVSPNRECDDKIDQKEKEGFPHDEADPLKKRKVSPMKPTSRKKSRATLTKMQTVLTIDDFDFIIAAVEDASQDILQKHEAK